MNVVADMRLLKTMNLDLLAERAKELANESNCHYPMCAFVLRSTNKILSYGVNKKGWCGKSIHAEVNAIRRLVRTKKRAKGAIVFVARHTKTGRRANARPCANCVEVMRMMGIKKVAWTTGRQTIEIASIDDVDTDYIPKTSSPSSYTGLECVMDRGD